MNASIDEIEKRMPVWCALSEFFLDTQLQTADLTRIATVLASSPFSEEKLEEILRFEVTPVCKWNLYVVAGEWAVFDEDWIRERIAPRLETRPFFRFGVHRGIRTYWIEVKGKIVRSRTSNQER